MFIIGYVVNKGTAYKSLYDMFSNRDFSGETIRHDLHSGIYYRPTERDLRYENRIQDIMYIIVSELKD